jgi:hypothetical protein
MADVTVVCVKWGNEYSDEYVIKLRNMIARNTTIDHNFLCFSDTLIDGIDIAHLPNDLIGWWNKLYLFSSVSMLYEKRVVYLDLDTVITGNIDWLLSYDGDFMGIENLGVRNKYENPENYKGVLQTGIMAWNRDSSLIEDLWNVYFSNKQQIQTVYRGDGEYIYAALKQWDSSYDLLQHLYPNQLKSYKYEVYEEGSIDPSTSIICFHGIPRPHQAIREITYPWGVQFDPMPEIGEYWK